MLGFASWVWRKDSAFHPEVFRSLSCVKLKRKGNGGRVCSRAFQLCVALTVVVSTCWTRPFLLQTVLGLGYKLRTPPSNTNRAKSQRNFPCVLTPDLTSKQLPCLDTWAKNVRLFLAKGQGRWYILPTNSVAYNSWRQLQVRARNLKHTAQHEI